MVLSDKKFIEFSEQVWERNKELLAEKRELLDEVRYFKELAFDRAVEIEKLRNENGSLRKELKEVADCRSGLVERLENENRSLRRELKEVNARFNETFDEQYERIRELNLKLEEIEREDEEMEEREREFKIFINPESGHVAAEYCDEFEDISDDWDDIFEDDLGASDRFINCTFNLNF